MVMSNEKCVQEYSWTAPIQLALLEKPLRITGIAIHAGMTRNWHIFLEDELKAAAETLKGKPVYYEHVSADRAIGRVVDAWWDDDVRGIRYVADIWDEDAAEKIRRGLIQHVSIAADYQRLDQVDGVVPRGLRFRELSLVAVPGDPRTNIQVVESLFEAMSRPLSERVVRFEETPPAPEDREWDADAAEQRIRKWASSDGSGDKDKIDWSKYRRAFAWYDPEHADDFGGYKLPHHDVIDGELRVVWRGVVAAMQALLGARGGVDIPEEDRLGVYRHLAGHYRQFGREPPAFHEAKQAEEKAKEAEGTGEEVREQEELTCAICGRRLAPPYIRVDGGLHVHLTCLERAREVLAALGELQASKSRSSPPEREGGMSDPPLRPAGGGDEGTVEAGKGEEGGENVSEKEVEVEEAKVEEAVEEAKDDEVSVLPQNESNDPREEVAKLLREAVTSSSAAAAIPQVWVPEISRKPAGLIANIGDYVKVYPQIEGKPGDRVKIPKLTSIEFAELTEATAPSEATIPIDAVEVTLKEYGALAKISYAVLEDVNADVVASLEESFEEAAKLAEDAYILSKLDAIADENLAAHIWGGDATGTADIDAADVFTPDLVAKAIGAIMAKGYAVKPGDLLLVLHPKQYEDLLRNEQFTNAARLGSPDVVKTGQISSYMGVDIVVSTKVPITAKDSVATGEPAVDVYHAFVLKKDAVALVPKRTLLIETERKTAERVLQLMATHRFGAEALFPDAVVKISTA